MAMLRTITPILIPLAILVAAWLLVPQIHHLPPSRLEMINLTPYLLTVAGLLLSFHFRRGRICLLLIISLIGYHLMANQPEVGADTPLAWILYRALAVLLPFNLLLVALMREKGVCGGAGRMRLFFLGFQFFLLWLTIRQGSQSLWVWLTSPFLHWQSLERVAIPQFSLFLLAVAGLLSLIRGMTRHSPVEGGFFGLSVAFIIMFNWPWTPHLIPVFSIASSLILVLSIVQESHNMAFRDDLTGLPSRRSLNEELSGLGSRYSIAMVDVDHFKRFNDRYGHDVGDQVLKMVAGQMLFVSGGGKSFRYGGEEFTVIYAGKSAKDAAPHLEKLRQDIADYKMNIRGNDRPKNEDSGQGRRNTSGQSGDVSVTVSIGVAEVTPNCITPAEVIKAADQALYKAKNGGRNQVCLASSR